MLGKAAAAAAVLGGENVQMREINVEGLQICNQISYCFII